MVAASVTFCFSKKRFKVNMAKSEHLLDLNRSYIDIYFNGANFTGLL